MHIGTQAYSTRFGCICTLLALVKSVLIEIKYLLIEYVVSNTASVKIFHSCPEEEQVMKKLTESHTFDILQRAAFIYSVKQHSEYTCEENTFRGYNFK